LGVPGRARVDLGVPGSAWACLGVPGLCLGVPGRAWKCLGCAWVGLGVQIEIKFGKIRQNLAIRSEIWQNLAKFAKI